MARNVVVGESDYVLPDEKEWYSAVLTKLEDGPPNTDGTSTLKWTFTFEIPDNEDLNGKTFNGLTTTTPTVKNRCGTFVAALMGVEIQSILGAELDLDDLADGAHRCQVMVVHKESKKGSGKFANVTDAKPAIKKKAAPAGKPATGSAKPPAPATPPKTGGQKPTAAKPPPPEQEEEPAAPEIPAEDADEIPF